MIIHYNHHPHCRIKNTWGGLLIYMIMFFVTMFDEGDLTCLDWTWLLTVYTGLGGYLKLKRHHRWFTLISLLALLLKNSVKDNKISIHKNECSDITISSLESTTAIHISFLTLAARKCQHSNPNLDERDLEKRFCVLNSRTGVTLSIASTPFQLPETDVQSL